MDASNLSSSTYSFATPADMMLRYDARTIGDLCSDAGTKLTTSQLTTSTRLLAVLRDASGMVEAAVMVGGQYSKDDLDVLSGNIAPGILNVTNAAYLLKRLVCDLAMGMLFLARPDREGQVPKSYEMALEMLEQLRKGERTFGLVSQQDAQKLAVEVEPERDVTNRAGIVVEAGRFFSKRNNRLHG